MLIEMELREILQGVDIDPTIVLVEKEGGNRQLPILVGNYEAEMLRYAVFRQKHPRPLTHDLILNVLESLGASLKRVIVDQMIEQKNGPILQGCYHGKLDVEMSDQTRAWVDSRPSDAIVLATKLSAPIFVDEGVFRSSEPKEDSEEEE